MTTNSALLHFFTIQFKRAQTIPGKLRPRLSPIGVSLGSKKRGLSM